MALSRRSSSRFQGAIWPGFVDAMTGLMLVLMFVLTIFMVVQFVLRETITGQAHKLDDLAAQVSALADELGLERSEKSALQTQMSDLTTTLSQTRNTAEERAAQIAQLLNIQAERDETITALEATGEALEQQNSSLAGALDELEAERDAQEAAARLAAAREAALEALTAELKQQNADIEAEAGALAIELSEAQARLSDEEKKRLAEAAAAELLRERFENSKAELDSLSLILEQERQKAEETLTLLAAARNEQTDLSRKLTDAERDAALLAVAREELSAAQSETVAAQRQKEVLNRQLVALRSQLAELRALIGEAQERDDAAQVQVENLGRDLNAALARAAAEERRRRQAEEEKNTLLAEKAETLERYRSDFFGQLRDLIENQDGVKIVGDRFVFGAEVLFPPGSAELSEAGRAEISAVGGLLNRLAANIPQNIEWILRVDGHTDDTPLSAQRKFSDNWELSQARALSVVRFMIDQLDVPPARLSANGFGQYQPLNPADTAEARAQNRRIELKLTER